MAHRKSLIQVKFRFRQDLLERLERAAKHNDRSANAEIVHRLEQSLRKEDEAAYMDRFATMAVEKFSADVYEKWVDAYAKSYAEIVRRFGAEAVDPLQLAAADPRKAAERAQLAAVALMAPILARIREPTEQDLQKLEWSAEAAAALMTPSLLAMLARIREPTEQDPQKPPTIAPERPEHRKKRQLKQHRATGV